MPAASRSYSRKLLPLLLDLSVQSLKVKQCSRQKIICWLCIFVPVCVTINNTKHSLQELTDFLIQLPTRVNYALFTQIVLPQNSSTIQTGRTHEAINITIIRRIIIGKLARASVTAAIVAPPLDVCFGANSNARCKRC